MAQVELRDVRKSYGASEVIHGIDLSVATGEFIVVVGPSGCGKSTLLRMIAGLEEISGGEIAIGGRKVNDLEPKDRDIAMVFQNYALYPHMSVYDNMAYGLKIAGVPRKEITERVEEAARILELGEFLGRKPRQLSGGQRQRVAMGRAIVRKPQVFLFDEPLSNLDAKLRVQMRLEIKQLQKRLGVTSVYVTHDQVEAMTLADRLVVMNEGQAEQIDSPMRVYENPASLFVAGFIGSPAMNMLKGQVNAKGDGFELAGGQRLPVHEGFLAATPSREVVIGIRPEHFEVADQSHPAELVLKVELIETLGADSLLHGRIGGAGDLITVRVSGATQQREGSEVALRVAPGELHLFEPENGQRIGDL